MGAVTDFFDEVNPLFGFFFDVGMACDVTLKSMERLLAERGVSDDSPYIVRDGPPEGTPEQEIENSLHATTIGALKQRLRDPGLDLSQAAKSVLVFVYHIWDEKYRGAVAKEKCIDPKGIQVDILGDMRLLRNSLIHNKGIAADDVANCRTFVRIRPGDRIELNKKDVIVILESLREQLKAYA